MKERPVIVYINGFQMKDGEGFIGNSHEMYYDRFIV